MQLDIFTSQNNRLNTIMSRLEEIKNEYAKEFDYGDWISFINDQPSWGIEGHMNDVCKRYAKECSQASLKKASENVKMKTKDNVHELSMMDDWSELDKESITNESNIVLL